MKTFTIADIKSWGYDSIAVRYLPADWQGTALDILQHETIPAGDKVGLVLREEALDLSLIRRFAIACACRVQHLMQDERSIKALDVAEAFLDKKATQEQLDAAGGASWIAAWVAKEAARKGERPRAAALASWVAGLATVWEVAQEGKVSWVVGDAVGEEAWAAAKEAWVTVESASAEENASWAAGEASRAALEARGAEWQAHVELAIKMIKEWEGELVLEQKIGEQNANN